MYKIRTMVLNSDDLLEVVEKTQGRDARGKIVDDMRLTRIGRFLKRHRFDELPQIINILRGEMSLIGPRPHSQCFADKWIPEDLRTRRLQVRPGLLKPLMAFADYDEGGLEWATERRFLDDLESGRRFVRLRYLLRIYAPAKYKWMLKPGGRRYSKKDFYTKREKRSE